MNIFFDFFSNFFSSLHPTGIVVLSIFAICFLIQLWYYLFAYSSIPGFRNSKGRPIWNENPDISVIVVLHDDYDYLERILPKMMAQDYDNFEVVIVSLGSSDNFNDELIMCRDMYRNLVTTHLEQDQRFPISNKMAINVGIKGSNNEHIIITTSDAYPTSDKWLALMAKGFAGSSVILGYAGLERKKGIDNLMQRSSQLMMSVRFLSAAINGMPYRAMIQNMGFTKKTYFDVRGFNHLNMNIGEDDLFIQAIAKPGNTGIVMNPHATIRQFAWDGKQWWRSRRLFLGHTYKFYPLRVKSYIATELISRGMLFISSLAAMIVFPYQIVIIVACLLLIRLAILLALNRRICRRLGEEGLVWGTALYDISAPLSELTLSLSRTFTKVNGVWR